MEEARDGIYVHDLSGTLLAVNRAVEDLTGRPRAALIGANVQELLAPEHRERSRAMLRRKLNGEQVPPHEVDLVAADGSRVPVEVNSRVVWRGGQPVAVEGVARDRRERRRFEAAMERVRHRQNALLRAARRLAMEASADDLMASVLAEATALLGADVAAVFRWDARRRRLIGLRSTLPGVPTPPDVRRGECAVGQAVVARRPVAFPDCQSAPTAHPAFRNAGVRAVAAAPLLEEGQLLGALWVGRMQAGRPFDADDLETLQILAGLAAGSLVGVERARLAGVLLAARTAQHEVNNRLAATVGYAELLASDPALPPHLRDIAALALDGARRASEVVDHMQRVTSLRELEWGGGIGPTIDVERSV